MRQIKFRAWDTKRKKMWSTEEMGKDQLTLSPDGRGFINVNGISTRLSQYMSHLIPLQFTGLHDKNGKELNWWEGDILKKDNGYLAEIVFHKGCFMGKWIGRDDVLDLFCFNQNFNQDTQRSEQFEVIGNIHENPELLENA